MNKTPRKGKQEAHWHILIAMLVKHYKVLFQSKSTLLTMILGPLIIVALIGASFNTSETQSLKVGVYSNTSTDLTEEITATLAEEFSLETVGSEEQCKELVITGVLQICLVFPNNFNPEMQNYENELVVYADSTQLNLAYIVTSQLNAQISVQSEEISTQYVQELLDTLNFVNGQLQTTSQNLAQLQASTQHMSTSLSSAQTQTQGNDFSFTSTAHDDFGTQLRLLQQTSTTLTSAIISVDELENMLYDDVHSLEVSLGHKREQYDEGCGVNGTDTDCDEQEEIIALIEDDLAELHSYYDIIANNTLSDLSINVTTHLTTLAPEANQIQQKLQEAKTKLGQAQSTINSVSLAISSSLSTTQTLSYGLQGVDTSTGSMQERIRLISVTDAETIATPLKTTYKKLEKEESSYITKLFPSILALFIMLVSILLSATFVIIEKKGSAFIRNHIAPVYSVFFPLTTLITLLSIVLVETFMILIVAQLFFHVNSAAFIGDLLIATLVGGSLFILLGMDIGLFFDNEESVSLVGTFLAVLMMLFSPLIFPLQSMAALWAKIAGINPFVIVSELFRKIILFDVNMNLYFHELMLCGFFIVLFIALYTISYALAVKKY